MNEIPRSAGDPRGSRLTTHPDAKAQQRTYGVGRVCAAQGCETHLSSYNPSTICALHRGGWKEAPLSVQRRSQPRAQISRCCAFAGCGLTFATSNPARKYCSDVCRMKAFQARNATRPAAGV